jgi:hypothetical protein
MNDMLMFPGNNYQSLAQLLLASEVACFNCGQTTSLTVCEMCTVCGECNCDRRECRGQCRCNDARNTA